MIRELTCIVCPRGCSIKIELDGKKIISVTGNTCKCGEAYAVSECTAPVRTLTTTAAIRGGGVVSVKTNKPVPKELLFECMEIINKFAVPEKSPAGYILIKNILNTGADVITTKNL